jgi:hypothetical protein
MAELIDHPYRRVLRQVVDKLFALDICRPQSVIRSASSWPLGIALNVMSIGQLVATVRNHHEESHDVAG